MSNVQTYYHFKPDFQKVDQHTGGKWLMHGTKRRKDITDMATALPWICKFSLIDSLDKSRAFVKTKSVSSSGWYPNKITDKICACEFIKGDPLCKLTKLHEA